MIGGNIDVTIQIRQASKNAIGEMVNSWTDYLTIRGYLDMISEDSRYTVYGAKVTDASHVLICDYVDIPVKESDCHLKVGTDIYDIVSIDDPMNLHRQIEILLRKVG